MALVSFLFLHHAFFFLKHSPQPGAKVRKRVATPSQIQDAAVVCRVIVLPHQTPLTVVPLTTGGRARAGHIPVLLRVRLPSTHLVH